MTKAKTQEIVPQQTTAIVSSLQPRTVGRGFEETADREMFSVPFLTILQSLSKAVDPSSAEYVEGAKPGDIFHTVSRKVMKSVDVIPVHFARTFIEWVPRKKGGGFRGEHPPLAETIEEYNSRLNRETGKAELDNGNELTDTRNHYVLMQEEDGAFSPALISMNGTQVKSSRDWVASMKLFRPKQRNPLQGPDMWQAGYRLTTVQRSNDKGKWYVWRATPLGEVTDDSKLAAGETFYEEVRGGRVVIDREQQQEHGESGGGDSDVM